MPAAIRPKTTIRIAIAAIRRRSWRRDSSRRRARRWTARRRRVGVAVTAGPATEFGTPARAIARHCPTAFRHAVSTCVATPAQWRPLRRGAYTRGPVPASRDSTPGHERADQDTAQYE